MPQFFDLSTYIEDFYWWMPALVVPVYKPFRADSKMNRWEIATKLFNGYFVVPALIV